MALIRSCRLSPRSGRAHFVPGSLACAASGRRLFAPATPTISRALKMAPGLFAARTVTRLAPACP